MTTKGQLLDAIRRTCLRCCCGSYKAVQDCQTEKFKTLWKEYEVCPLFPYRLGEDPTPAKGGRNPFLKNKIPSVHTGNIETNYSYGNKPLED